MRKAFYAGAHAIMFKVIAILSTDAEPTEEDIKVLKDLDQKIQEFALLVITGAL